MAQLYCCYSKSRTMKSLVLLSGLLLFTCCTWSQTNKKALQDTSKKQSVKVVPNDSHKHRMPIQKADTYRNTMPVIDPEQSNIKPK